MAREDLLTRTLVELADNLVADFDVVEFLTFLSHRSVELVDAGAAGIVLADTRGDLRYMASSGEDAKVLELFELQTDEGPCLDCFRRGEPVIRDDLDAPDVPWPRFAQAAAQVGFRSVHAFPMRLRHDVLGSLNLFGARSLPASDLLVAQALADVATISIIQNKSLRDSQQLAEHLGLALNSRVLIEQAKGVLAERCQIDMQEAFTRLRRHSRDHGRRLSDVAAAIIDGSLTADVLGRLPEQA